MKEKLLFLMQLLSSLEEQVDLETENSRLKAIQIQEQVKKIISDLR